MKLKELTFKIVLITTFLGMLVLPIVFAIKSDGGRYAPSQYTDTPLTVVINGREY